MSLVLLFIFIIGDSEAKHMRRLSPSQLFDHLSLTLLHLVAMDFLRCLLVIAIIAVASVSAKRVIYRIINNNTGTHQNCTVIAIYI